MNRLMELNNHLLNGFLEGILKQSFFVTTSSWVGVIIYPYEYYDMVSNNGTLMK